MIPHASEKLSGWRARRRVDAPLLVALDFDGTLAAIAEHPSAAVLQDQARDPLERLAVRADSRVAIVSGRGLVDVRRLVPVAGIYFAGNHGMEIDGPGVHEVLEEARAARPALSRCATRLAEAFDSLPGIVLEDKELSLSVHYRLVREPDVAARVETAVRSACSDSGLRITFGKKVVEVRPDVDWDKGRATLFLLAALAPAGGTDLPALFIGDDLTDEDAFRALRGRGDGVIVADAPPADTQATCFVRSPAEVAALLNGLAEE